jgi:hypothetical protein
MIRQKAFVDMINNCRRFRYPFELRGFSHPLVETVRRRIERVPRDQIGGNFEFKTVVGRFSDYK